MPAPRFVLDDFWPSDLFLGGIPGAWYDPTDVNVNWRRNLLTYTEQFDNAAWAKVGTGTGSAPVVTPNAAVAPDGTLTADSIVFNRGAGNTIGDQSYVAQGPTVTNATYTQTIWLKAATPSDVGKQLGLRNVGGTSYLAVTLTADWVRYTRVETGSSANFEIANRGTITTGNSVTALVWGAQLEVGSTATTYQQIVTPEITYAATQTTNLFQDSTGTTPVWAVEQPVGLILDKSQGLALGPELVTNGSFSVDANWTKGTGWTISGGSANYNATGNNALSQSGVFASGKTYLITFTMTVTSGGINLWINGTQLVQASITTSGTKTFRVTTTTAGSLFFEATAAAGVLSIDNVSVVEIAGNHASQSTAASRPTYRARYNLLTYSEQFDDAAWVKDSAGTGVAPVVTPNAGTAPDGTTTADRVQFNRGAGTPAFSRIRQTASAVASTTCTWSVWMRTFSGGTQFIGLRIDGTGATCTVTGTWQRFQVSATTTAADCQILSWTSLGSDQTADLLVWGAQLLTAADVTATGNAYQRIAAATVYDTAPIFRPYLAFDGVDDSLSTAAIDMTSTDAATIFAGVHKASDAALAILAETSALVSANAGSLFALVPGQTGALGNYGWTMRGSINPVSVQSTAILAPDTAVLTMAGDISNDFRELRVDGVQNATSSADMGAGNLGNYPLFIGRRNNASLPLNGRLYSLIVRGAASSVTEIADTELWVNARTGAY